MKTVKVILQAIKWIFILTIVLFSLTTLLNKSYAQTIILWLITITLIYWPRFFKKNKNKMIHPITRIGFIIMLSLIYIYVFPSDPKTSIYINDNLKTELYQIYDENVKRWPAETKDIYLETQYGKVHILACGSKNNPPLMMLHAASMGAHSWLENLDPLINHYRIYSFDNPGEGNKSELNDVNIFPRNGKELADMYAKMANDLGIDSCPVFGASNGGFIAQNYAFYYPEKVERLALFGPMGLTQLKNQSFFMMGAATMYPLDCARNAVTHWAIGNNEYVNSNYGDWFNCILRGTIPSLAAPVPMTTEQKQKMKLPVLLFLGTEDAIVGDAELVQKTALDYPNIKIEVLKSGHLIAVEHAEYVNKIIADFLYNNQNGPEF